MNRTKNAPIRYLGSLVLTLLLAAAGAAAAVKDAKQVVEETTNKVLDLVLSQREQLREDPERLRRMVDEIVAPHFDFPLMTQWALGKHWREASEEQRQQLVRRFKDLLIGTYSTALLEYSNERIKYQPVRAEEGASRVTVKTEIAQPGGPPIPVHYRMHRRDGEWKAYDVAVDGVSFVTTYRADFAAVIRREGIAGLLSTLAERHAANVEQ